MAAERERRTAGANGANPKRIEKPVANLKGPSNPTQGRVSAHDGASLPGLLERADPSLRSSMMLRMQQRYGNQSAAVMVQRAPATTVTFDEPTEITGHRLSLGAASEDANRFIDHQVNHFRDGYEVLNNNYMGGLKMFTDRFIFASTAEAEPKYAEVALKYAFKKAVSAIFEKLGEKEGPLPGVGKVYELTVGLVEELEKEHERVEKAELQVSARDYVNKYTNAMSEKFGSVMKGMEENKTALIKEYSAYLKSFPPEDKAQQTAKPTTVGEEAVITGPGAEYLQTLKAKVDGFWASIPKNAGVCELAFAEGWVMGSEGEIESKGGGDVYMNGRMRMDWHALLKDGDLTFDPYPKEASLAAKGADKMADVLMENIKEGRTIDRMQILKQLTIDVEDYVSWGFNNHFYVHVAYRSPNDIEFVSTVPSPVDSSMVPRVGDVQQMTLKRVDLAALSQAISKIVAY